VEAILTFLILSSLHLDAWSRGTPSIHALALIVIHEVTACGLLWRNHHATGRDTYFGRFAIAQVASDDRLLALRCCEACTRRTMALREAQTALGLRFWS
jgi:hypothetical protein